MVLVLIRNFLFVGSYTHLWYLPATAIATLIVCWMIKKKLSLKATVLICSFLYIIGLLGTTYFGLLRPLENIGFVWSLLKLYKLVFNTTRNGFFFGVMFVGMGALFAYKRIYISKLTAIIGFIVSMLLMFVEAFLIGYFDFYLICDLYIFLIPSVFFLFYITTHIEIKETSVTIALRKYSSIIYFVHSWVNFVLSVIIKIIEFLLDMEIDVHSLLRFTIVSIVSLVISIIFVELQKYKPFRWLKNIIRS